MGRVEGLYGIPEQPPARVINSTSCCLRLEFRLGCCGPASIGAKGLRISYSFIRGRFDILYPTAFNEVPNVCYRMYNGVGKGLEQFSADRGIAVICFRTFFDSLKVLLTSPGGLEPPTFRLTAERANRLRHGDAVGGAVTYIVRNKSLTVHKACLCLVIFLFCYHF